MAFQPRTTWYAVGTNEGIVVLRDAAGAGQQRSLVAAQVDQLPAVRGLAFSPDGRLLASAREVRLSGVEFLVRESGRRRMLENGRRNIHAYAVGTLVDYVHPEEPRSLERFTGRPVSYNPYQQGSFVDDETSNPVAAADLAHFDETGVIYA